MQPIYDVATRRFPTAIFTIARSLGEPMRANRFHKLPVSPGRRWQIWEFQSLADTTMYKVVAVDIRDRWIADWKLLTDAFEQVVQDYQRRIDEHRRHYPAYRTAVATIREGQQS